MLILLQLKKMVKLTSALVTRKVTNKYSKGTGKDNGTLKKLTHLQLQGNFIDTIGDISRCKNLTVLYLHNNYLTKIDNLECATQLTHLYLQRNKIDRIENLNGLKRLKKLYIGHNCIAVVEGLDKLYNLEELHIQKQQLPKGEALHFDPRTTKGLAKCLHVLDVTGNGISSIADLECLQEMRLFMAQNNQLNNITDILHAVSHWYHLTNLELKGNPVCSQQKYREQLITCSNSLELLDEKPISDTTRDFLRRLDISKVKHHATPQLMDTTATLSADIKNLTKNFTPGVKKSITHSILHDAELTAILGNDANKPINNPIFPAWKSCFEAENKPRSGLLVPRPFWRQVRGDQALKTETKKMVENLHLPHL